MVETLLNKPTETPELFPQDHNLEETTEMTVLPSVQAAMSIGASAGEVDMSDFKIPYLSIAYGVGKLSDKFHPGDWVVSGEHLIAKKNEKIKIVILTDVKYFKERLKPQDYSNGMKPRRFMTREEVLAAGGTLEWVETENGKLEPTFGPAMDMKLLIQKPESLGQGIFGIEVENNFYTAAYYSVDKSGYTRVGKEILTQKSMCLQRAGGILAGVWELWTETQVVNKKPTVVPMISLVGRTTEDFRKEAKALFG